VLSFQIIISAINVIIIIIVIASVTHYHYHHQNCHWAISLSESKITLTAIRQSINWPIDLLNNGQRSIVAN